MRFTEHELTVGVEAVARTLHRATRPPWRRRDADDAFAGLDRAARYRHLAAAGEVVLPVLLALPDRPTVGRSPQFDAEEWRAAAAEGGRQVLERRRPGAWDAMPEKRRARTVASSTALARIALEAMPPRSDPDALTPPDGPHGL